MAATSAAPSRRQLRAARQRSAGFGRGGGFGGGLTVSGTVVSVTGDTLTIKTASGQTVEVTTGASTTYNTQAPASASDVQAGKTVQVQLDFAGGGGGGRPNAELGTDRTRRHGRQRHRRPLTEALG